jgi:hypothetical protein
MRPIARSNIRSKNCMRNRNHFKHHSQVFGCASQNHPRDKVDSQAIPARHEYVISGHSHIKAPERACFFISASKFASIAKTQYLAAATSDRRPCSPSRALALTARHARGMAANALSRFVVTSRNSSRISSEKGEAASQQATKKPIKSQASSRITGWAACVRVVCVCMHASVCV